MTRLLSRFVVFGLVLGLVMAPAAALAQGAGDEPLSGSLVTLSDSSMSALDHDLTNSNGEYALVWDSDGDMVTIDVSGAPSNVSTIVGQFEVDGTGEQGLAVTLKDANCLTIDTDVTDANGAWAVDVGVATPATLEIDVSGLTGSIGVVGGTVMTD